MSLAGPLFGADDGDTAATASSVALRPTDREQWHMQALHDRLKMTAVEDLRSFAAIAAAHAAGTKAFLPAFAALYQIMPAEQQVNADRVFREADPKAQTGITAPQ